MKKAAMYVGVFVVVFGLLMMLGREIQRQEARARAETRATKRRPTRAEVKFPRWEKKHEWSGEERGPVKLVFASKIKTENLWDPFFMSGPVHSWYAGFVGAAIQVTDITNLPDRWPNNFSDTVCGTEDDRFQLWEVELKTEGAEGPEPVLGYYWVCEETETYQGVFECELTEVERVNLCTFRVANAEEGRLTLSFEPCMDGDGNAYRLELTCSLAEAELETGDTFEIGGLFEGCLHKGTAHNRYIRQELACNCYDIDLEEWDERFGCPDHYEARAIEPATAVWECVNSTVGCDDCADGAWGCEVRGGGPDHAVDAAGRVWMAYEHQQNIRIVDRDSPQREWGERTPAFNEMQHTDPSIVCFADQTMIVAATRLMGHTELMLSRDYGQSWEQVGGELGNDLEFGTLDETFGIMLMAGYAEVEVGEESVGYAWFELSDDGGKTKHAFHDGNTRKKIGLSDKKQPAILILGTQEILATVTRGSRSYLYTSRDFGETWTYGGAGAEGAGGKG